MPTFTSPVAVSDLQYYLRDTSTDSVLLAYYQSILNAATEAVYTWLDRDFTPSVAKTDVFIGDDTNFHRLHDPAQSITSWTSVDSQGLSTTNLITDLILRDRGRLVLAKTGWFDSESEHTIVYRQPDSLTCPEAVRQVITEIAVEIFYQSGQGMALLGIAEQYNRDTSGFERQWFLDLSARHKEMLRPYKHYPV